MRHRLTHNICPQYRAVLEYAVAQGYTLPSLPQQKIANSIIDYLVQRGQWDTVFECFWLEANDGSRQMGRINYINPGTYNITEAGSPTWTSNIGFINTSTADRISLTFNPFVDASAKFTRRDHSLIAWRYNNISDNQAGIICSRSSATDVSLFGNTNPSNGLASMRVFDVSGDDTGVGTNPPNYDGLFHYKRIDSGLAESAGQDSKEVYQQGVFTGSTIIPFANSSGRSLPNMPYLQGARYTSGAIVDRHDTTPFSFAALGHGTNSNAPEIYKAISYYMTNL